MDAGFLPGREHPGLEVTYSPPSSDEFKNGLSHTSAVHICLRGVGKENEKSIEVSFMPQRQ
jgi:hypothetical protein